MKSESEQERHERERRADRLKQARRNAGFRGPTGAAEAIKINVNTYKAHETGRNGFGVAAARAYARLFKVSLKWLYFGQGLPEDGDNDVADALQELFEWVATAPEDIQSRVASFISFERDRLEKSRDTTTSPES